ncbi:MAG: prolipoprotein diacylglyceryl transferase [Saccharofermentans sp.]|nr:prolipoprotein diacylglyceryl transferase [Saccharofermentans sp.]
MLSTFDILGRDIPTYGLMAATGVICGLLFIIWRTRKLKLDIEYAVFLYMLGVVGAGIGAKLLYLLLSISDIQRAVLEFGFFKAVYIFIQGGMVFYGGLIGAIITSIAVSKLFKIDIKKYYPSLVPGIAILAGFGRIGCLLEGCCYGAPTSFFIHVIYPKGSQAPALIPLVPVQAYEMAFEFVVAILFVVLSFKKPQINSHLLRIYLASYAVMRFILEFWRGDQVRGIWGLFSTSQWISLVILVALLCYELLSTKKKLNRI